MILSRNWQMATWIRNSSGRVRRQRREITIQLKSVSSIKIGIEHLLPFKVNPNWMKLAVKYISFPPVKRFERAAGRAWSRLRRISMQYGNWVLGFPSPGCPIIAPILSRKRGDEAIFAPISNFLSELKKRKTTVVLQETSKSRDVLHAESF